MANGNAPAATVQPPASTYRVQLHASFRFSEAADIVEYLSALGVSHLYCSPYLQAARGSMHGYDVVDHSRVNRELGGDEGHVRLFNTLRDCRMGQVLDIVPNHMSIADADNRWWWDVLEDGPASHYAAYFDVDWQPPEAKLHNMILLPILGDHYGRELDGSKMKLERRGGAFVLRYHEHTVPLSPRSIEGILHSAAERYDSDALDFLADGFARLPLSTATDRASVRLRHRDKGILRGLLEKLCKEDVGVAATIDNVLAETTFDRESLNALLDRQNYRLAYWRTAGQQLDYRRFFDVTTLASLRTEDEQVFNDTHALILQWVKEGVVDGLRIDHPDGLRDPDEYVERLRRAAPRAWIVAEKILEPGEQLRRDWPVQGTTGYDFLNLVNGLFVDPDGETPLTEFYAEFTGQSTDYHAVVRDKKHLVLKELFAAELNRLVALVERLCDTYRHYRDYTRRELTSALRELAACFPIYRTYVRAEAGQIDDDDVRYAGAAVESAKVNRPEIDPALFDFLLELLTLKKRGETESEFVMRFQQLTGPVMAKGLEDTVFYCFNRLVSLNEVGGDPGRFGVPLDEFHQTAEQTQRDWPQTMLTLTTHDTKRSEDARARINLLSEIPSRWQEAVQRWSQINEKHRRVDFHDRNMEYLLYQTLVGAWPIDLERLTRYATKAAREAKTNTAWTNVSEGYEQALHEFIKGILGDDEFRTSLESFIAPLVDAGWRNSLSQTLLKLMSPGVPDTYQGTELWDLSQVDPDNRRPVDYDSRRRLLASLDELSVEDIWQRRSEGLPKMWITRQSLTLRREHPEWFDATATYQPLAAKGSKASHVVSFIRSGRVIVVAPRWPLRLADEWDATSLDLPKGNWQERFSGLHYAGTTQLAKLLERLPVALLVSES